MEPLLKISASTAEVKTHFDVLECFIQSAATLHGVACDALVGNSMCRDSSNANFITSFFLYRHSIELAIKALIKESKNIDFYGHNIKKMLEEHILNYKNDELIVNAFRVLEKYKILEDAQLFRYHKDRSCVGLENMPSIKNEDIEALNAAAWHIRQAVLECAHLKKIDEF